MTSFPPLLEGDSISKYDKIRRGEEEGLYTKRDKLQAYKIHFFVQKSVIYSYVCSSVYKLQAIEQSKCFSYFVTLVTRNVRPI